MIWGCSECRDDVEGPKNPEPHHACRLCSSCSLRLGEFVFRKPKKRRGPRSAKKNPRLKHSWHGVDLSRELERLIAHCPDHLRERPPTLYVKHQKKLPATFGWADPNLWQVQVVLWPHCPLAWALSTIVHELAHFCVPAERAAHGDGFRMAMIELCRDGYGVDPPMPEGRRIVNLDHAVEDALQFWVDQNVVPLPANPDPEKT